MARSTGWLYELMSSQPVCSAKSVEARKSRYLPLLSHVGSMTSESPSVSCLVVLSATWYTNTAWNCEPMSRFW